MVRTPWKGKAWMVKSRTRASGFSESKIMFVVCALNLAISRNMPRVICKVLCWDSFFFMNQQNFPNCSLYSISHFFAGWFFLHLYLSKCSTLWFFNYHIWAILLLEYYHLCSSHENIIFEASWWLFYKFS